MAPGERVTKHPCGELAPSVSLPAVLPPRWDVCHTCPGAHTYRHSTGSCQAQSHLDSCIKTTRYWCYRSQSLKNKCLHTSPTPWSYITLLLCLASFSHSFLCVSSAQCWAHLSRADWNAEDLALDRSYRSYLRRGKSFAQIHCNTMTSKVYFQWDVLPKKVSMVVR